MNHDISHCEHASCAKKDNCYRYLAHLDLVAKQDVVGHTYARPTDDIEKEGCSLYWHVEVRRIK